MSDCVQRLTALCAAGIEYPNRTGVCRLVRTGSQFRELFQEIVSRGGLDIEELEAIILNLVLDMVPGFSSGSFE